MDLLKAPRLALSILFVATTGAAAETVVLLPVGGHSALEDKRPAVHAALLASLQDRYETVIVQELNQAPCDNALCAPSLLAFHRADFVVGGALWFADRRTGSVLINIMLITSSGERLHGKARDQLERVEAAARRGS